MDIAKQTLAQIELHQAEKAMRAKDMHHMSGTEVKKKLYLKHTGAQFVEVGRYTNLDV